LFKGNLENRHGQTTLLQYQQGASPAGSGIAYAVIGALILLTALISLNNTRSFLAGAERLEARVVAMQVDTSGGAADYLPMLEFADGAGTLKRLPGWQRGPDYGFAKGERVAILYNPALADTVRIDNWRDTWKLGLNLLFVAAFFLVMALGGLILHRRWMRERAGYGARNDILPEDAKDEIIYVNAHGRLRFLSNPKPAAIMLGLSGAAMGDIWAGQWCRYGEHRSGGRLFHWRGAVSGPCRLGRAGAPQISAHPRPQSAAGSRRSGRLKPLYFPLKQARIRAMSRLVRVIVVKALEPPPRSQ